MWRSDGERVLTWSGQAATLWATSSGTPVTSPLEHQDTVEGAIFNRDGARVLTWSKDKTARLWNTATGEAIEPVLEHRGGIRGAAFNRRRTAS